MYKFIILALMFGISSAQAQTQARVHARVIVESDDMNKVIHGVGKPITKLSKNKAAFSLSSGQIALLQKTFKNIKIEADILFAIPKPIRVSGKPTKTVTQPAQTVPWGINAVRARDVLARGEGIRVCVVDTGVDASHPDLTGQVEAYGVPGLNYKSADDNGHGTHVSGTVVAADNTIGVVGVAPRAKVVSVKALNRNGSGYSSDLANAIDVCISKGSHVINASWGSSSYSSVIADAVKRAAAAGVYFVAAAGNESTKVSYPAALPEAIAITAIDSSYRFASFSNFGPEVDYTAPGVSVLSTVPGGKYESWNGTSMAAPHAAGVIALMLSSQLNQIGARVLSGLSLDQQGQGLIDAYLSAQ